MWGWKRFIWQRTFSLFIVFFFGPETRLPGGELSRFWAPTYWKARTPAGLQWVPRLSLTGREKNLGVTSGRSTSERDQHMLVICNIYTPPRFVRQYARLVLNKSWKKNTHIWCCVFFFFFHPVRTPNRPLLTPLAYLYNSYIVRRPFPKAMNKKCITRTLIGFVQAYVLAYRWERVHEVRGRDELESCFVTIFCASRFRAPQAKGRG